MAKYKTVKCAYCGKRRRMKLMKKVPKTEHDWQCKKDCGYPPKQDNLSSAKEIGLMQEMGLKIHSMTPLEKLQNIQERASRKEKIVGIQCGCNTDGELTAEPTYSKPKVIVPKPKEFKICLLCDSPMSYKDGYYKCNYCGGFTRSC